MRQGQRHAGSPRLEQAGPYCFAGLSTTLQHVAPADALTATERVPEVWRQLASLDVRPAGIVSDNQYGVLLPEQTATGLRVTYLAALQVSAIDPLPPPYEGVVVNSCQYAMFTHHGPIRELPRTLHQAFELWLPHSGYAHIKAAPHLEVYDARFSPRAADSVMEYWVPVTSIKPPGYQPPLPGQEAPL